MVEQTLPQKEKQAFQGREQTRPGRYFVPDVDICEYEHELRLWVDMPGVPERNVEVTLKDGALVIEGLIDPGLYGGLSPRYTEYNVGNFYRQFTLNENIDESRIGAKMRNGVLELTLPKAEKAMPRRINVAAA